MRFHYLQHVPFEGLGCIADWANDRGHTVSATALYRDEQLPGTDAYDFLIVMGGPMGVHDTAEHKWLTKEKQFIERALKADKRVLGICLGAQLMADVLGARVYKNSHKEIGWFPVTRASATDQTDFEGVFPKSFFAFHWHGDTFDLPSGALHLAQSEACRHQAFYYPPAAMGLQFHLESTSESISLLLQHCSHELTSAPYIQSEDEIRNQFDRVSESNERMVSLLDSYR